MVGGSSSRWCETIMLARFGSVRSRSVSDPIRASRAGRSSPLAGSSSTSKRGRVIRARATRTRWRSPWEQDWISRSSIPARPTWAINSRARRLSASVQLTDPAGYEGGDLQFRGVREIETAPRARGVVIVFSSFIQDRVTACTKGTRKAVVVWTAGLPFR